MEILYAMNILLNNEKLQVYKIQFYEIDEFIREPEIGNDNIHTNHLRYSTHGCLSFIRELFNAIIQHGYMPETMLQGEIRPRLKNRFGNKADSVTTIGL